MASVSVADRRIIRLSLRFGVPPVAKELIHAIGDHVAAGFWLITGVSLSPPRHGGGSRLLAA